MDAKITKKRLNDFLSYEWIKIIALAVAGIIAWTLIFTVSSVRLNVGQQFKIFLYTDIAAGDGFGEFSARLKSEDILSYDVLDFSYEQLMGDTAATVLSARFAVHEGDLMILTDTEEEGESSSFKNFVDIYGAYPIDKLMQDAKDYYESFFDGDEINLPYLKQVFKARMKKDNRFKTASDYELGEQLEKARIMTLKDAWEKLNAYLLDNSQNLKEYSRFSEYIKNNPDAKDYEAEAEAKPYGLDLSFAPSVTELFIKRQDGKSDGITLVVLDRLYKQPHLQFEVIPVICEIYKLNSYLVYN